MMIKKKIVLFASLFCLNLVSQNKQLLYNFAELPQTLLLNPGTETNYKFHVSIPLLSGFSTNIGLSKVTLADVFRNDGVSINNRLRTIFNKISPKDYLFANNQIEVLNGGFRKDAKTYISFGIYTELDVFSSFPKDIVELLAKGNTAFLNKNFSASQVNIRTDLASVFHVGFTRKVNKDFTFGGRLKVYSGVVNAQTIHNYGTFTTTLGENSIYQHHLSNLNATINTSGVSSNDDEDVSDKKTIKNLYNFSNLGLGIDVGFTYHLSPQEEITASILDVGFIKYKNGVKNIQVKGNYTFLGVDFLYDGNGTSYFNDLGNSLKESVTTEENENSYTTLRPTKFYTSYKYSWGRSRTEKTCYDIGYKNYYNNAIGVQFFSVTRPIGLQYALTAFYERNFGKLLKTKLTYTVDDFSNTNLGFGFSSNLGAFNVYGMIDNLIQINDIADSNYISFQFGFNLIFN